MGPSGLKEDCQNNSLWKVPTPSSLLTSAILWQPRKATWFNLQAISITDPQQCLCCCLYGWLSVSCGEFVASSRWHLLLAEAQPFEEKGREKKKKNPNQDACTCCSLPPRLGVLLKDWDICTEGRAAAAGACPGWGWSSSGAREVWRRAARRGRPAAGAGSHYPGRTQTRLKYFKPYGLWHKQDSSAWDLQWI